ncbi:MAG: MBL fold metallo-hydrolase [Deltaproteobacteria bacterium]|nr:MBL fold metallo-hydrolase [Deltaproteobacteria bacterium]MBW1911620.1 MBL fold metallo-hydrolase [Deltaproteobacteria bacterium]
MKVTFYGTRGSIPVAEKEMIQIGGNTACILVRFDNEQIAILDSGTGIRKLGNEIVSQGIEQFANIYIALSHTHLDHIHGFPFFKPAYDNRRHFTISFCGKERAEKELGSIFSGQMRRDYFPIPMQEMGANFTFWEPDETSYKARSGIRVRASLHSHPIATYGYRFEEEGKVLAYITDVEHINGIDHRVVNLAENADLLIHDAQYTPEELKEKKGWGHSSWEQAVEVAERASVKRLALFHHDPEHSDKFLFNMESECRKRFDGAFLAIEGQTVEF